MSERDIVLTGVPRGGTTLACALLQQSPETVALFEPMDVAAVVDLDRARVLSEVERFFIQSRERALSEGVVVSHQVDGRVPDNPFASERDASGRRPLLVTPGLVRLDPRPSPGFTLVVKHNALFTALLPELSTRFRTLAIVRHPLSVLASWNSLELPVSDGRLPVGERLDPDLHAHLQERPDRLQRQLAVLEWFYSSFHAHLPGDHVLRYEDIISSQGELLRRQAGVSGQPIRGLAERNSNPLYPRREIPALAQALGEKPGSWQHWYAPESIAPAAARLAAQAGG